MIIIPYNTDAPIYHWPWVTLTMIVANIFIFFAQVGEVIPFEPWMLEFGEGLHPLQWLSCNFIHFDIFHLGGNMIFLWGFGIIVEGKLGWWRYLLVYLGVGIAQGFFVQLLMLGYAGDGPSGAGGASSVIFGLLAIALVWAPKNELSCLFIFFFFIIIRVFAFETTILTFSIYFLGFQLVFAALQGFSMSSEVLHLVGAVVGFGVGMAMLKLDWVDCENWDLLSVLSNKHGGSNLDLERYALGNYETRVVTADPEPGQTRKKHRSPRGDDFEEADASSTVFSAQQAATAKKKKRLARMHAFLKAGKPREALAEYEKVTRVLLPGMLEEADVRALAEGLYKARLWDEATLVLEDHIELFPEQSDRTRTMLATIMTREKQRPRYALRLIDPIDAGQLPPKLQAFHQQLKKRALRMIDEGVVELES